MKTQVECLPCLCRNAWDIAQRMTQDPFLRERIVKSAARNLSCCELKESPPEIAGGIIALANVLAHPESKEIKDIYREEKKRTAQLAATLVKMLPELPEYDEKDFGSRLRLAVSGNIIDFGVFSSPTQEMALQALKSAFSKPVDVSAVRELEEAVKKAERILYVLDNCGEANLDGLFLAPFRDKVTLVVRGEPVFNDVTKADLSDAGLAGIPCMEIPGTVPGLALEKTNEAVRKVFEKADLVIAKGQGNFETLNEYKGKRISFLFLAKCPVVTALLGVEKLSLQVINHNF
ncbi:MAG: DUF89 family protein [Lentisphaeria bacterium]|nr:DUF89 family protein [Lentisphaeria bacterium]